MKTIYLDNNATTSLDPLVLEAMLQELQQGPANPSSVHSLGKAAAQRLNQARASIADFLKVKPQEIFFTSGATEGLNMILRGVFSLKPGHIITSNVEHAAVYKTLLALEKQGVSVTYLPVGLWGALSVEQIKAAITPQTRMIVLSAANSETGVKQPIHEIAQLARESGIPFVIDAVGWIGKEPFIKLPGMSALVLSGHKFHGPKGIGLVWIDPKLKLDPLLTGGEQEYSKRAGTENLPAIIGLAKAIELLQQDLPAKSHYMKQLRDLLMQQLRSYDLTFTVNGEGPKIANTLNISFPDIDPEALFITLDRFGIAASQGSACASGALEPSRVLINMGLSKDISKAAIRFSLSRMTTEEEILQAARIIDEAVTKLKGLTGNLQGK